MKSSVPPADFRVRGLFLRQPGPAGLARLLPDAAGHPLLPQDDQGHPRVRHGHRGRPLQVRRRRRAEDAATALVPGKVEQVGPEL